ncbi:MAG TPA: ATP-binding protein [Bryobacteraceae bacterium]|nr:ATP-binding protein [Bryobacteraceae bacterium]
MKVDTGSTPETALERLYRLQVEELQDYALFLIDTDGVIANWNSGVGTILQYTRTEFVGKNFAQLFVPEDRKARAPENEMLTAARYGKSADVRWHLRKDGSRVFVDGTLYAVRENDEVVGFTKIMRDATARHESEKALRRSRDDLAEFAHVVAHDLQAPLRTMKSYAQLLAKRYRGQFDESADTFLAFVLEGANNMEALIAGLLNYSEFGGKGAAASVSLGDVVEAVVAALRIPKEECAAQITWGDLPVVEANPTHLRQLFQNLIDNALKYRSSRPPEIDIRAELKENQWLISVADNGLGIAPEYQQQIFLPLRRLHGPEIAGSGLGLAVCKRIVESYEGRMWVHSIPGQGSTFYFTLPRTNKLSAP